MSALPGTEPASPRRRALTDIAAEIERTRQREHVFGQDAAMFGDPAWLMLLHLYVDEKSLEENLLADLGRATGAAPSTLRRILAWALDTGMVVPHAGATFALSPAATERIEQVYRPAA